MHKWFAVMPTFGVQRVDRRFTMTESLRMEPNCKHISVDLEQCFSARCRQARLNFIVSGYSRHVCQQAVKAGAHKGAEHSPRCAINVIYCGLAARAATCLGPRRPSSFVKCPAQSSSQIAQSTKVAGSTRSGISPVSPRVLVDCTARPLPSFPEMSSE